MSLVIPAPAAAGSPNPLPIVATALTSANSQTPATGTNLNRDLAATIAQYAGRVPPATWFNLPGARIINGHLHFRCSKQHGSRTLGREEYQLWCFYQPKLITGLPRSYCRRCNN